MRVCLSCYRYATDCICDKSNKQSNIVEIDDDFADIILELNELFSYFQINVKTIFCCAGHLIPINVAPDLFMLQSYIMFEGDFMQFAYFLYGIDKVQEEALFKDNPNLTLSIKVFNQEECHYKLSVQMKTNKLPTLQDKILFMQGKVRMMKFLADKIKQKWDDYNAEWDYLC